MDSKLKTEIIPLSSLLLTDTGWRHKKYGVFHRAISQIYPQYMHNFCRLFSLKAKI